MAGDSYRAGFGGVMVLAVAAARPRQEPALALNESDHLTDFHNSSHLQLSVWNFPGPVQLDLPSTMACSSAVSP